MLQAHIIDHFENLLEYYQWVNTGMQSLTAYNRSHLKMFEREEVEERIQHKKSWYGSKASFNEMKKGITEYAEPELMDRVYEQVNEQISSFVKNQVQINKVMYNPNGLGVFVFDRAAMGMYRLNEYYSPSLNKVVEPEEVEQWKKAFRLIKDKSPVIERWEEKDGKPKVRTSSKNVFAYRKKREKERIAVELFISCGANANTSANEMLYSGIAPIIVAEILEREKIPTKISVVFGSSPDRYLYSAYACIVPVKQYDEPLDKNLLACLSSDARFFRYEGFKGIVALYDSFKEVCPGNLGHGMNRDYLHKVIEHSSYTRKANFAPNRFYFGWTFSEKEVIKEIKQTIKKIAERVNS